MTETEELRARRQRFEQLVTGLHADMYRYALWLCRDPHIAEEVLQETLVRAWRSLDALREESAARPWLLTIVRRENARYFERKRPDTVDVDNLTPAQSAQVADGHDSDVDDLRDAIFGLPDDYREPLVLQVLLGYSTKEIAGVMGLTQGAVLTRLHRARQQLKERLDRDARA